MAAAQDNCQAVYAVDCSKVMCHIAEEVKQSPKINPNVADKIKIINMLSTDMSIPKDIPKK